jgi:hypothetical protein
VLTLLVPAAAADAANISDFYGAVSSLSFTLLGLWWVVVQLRYQGGGGDPRRRRHAYGVALFFLLPGLMSLLSSIDPGLSALWRVAFCSSAVLGIVEVVLYLQTAGVRTPAAVALRAVGLVLYVLIAVVALRPRLTADLSLGLAPQELEAILLALVIFVGANLAWLGLTEPEHTGGA